MTEKTVFSGQRAIILIAAILLVPGASAASSISIDSSDKVLWMNGEDQVLDGKYDCSGQEAKLLINSSKGEFSKQISAGSFSKDFDTVDLESYGYGSYSARLDCGNDGSVEELVGFEVKRLIVWRIRPRNDLTVYQGGFFSLSFNASDGSGAIDLNDNENFEYRAGFLNGENLRLTTPNPSGDDITFSSVVPEDTTPGEKTLVTGLKYTSPSDEVIQVGSENRGRLKVRVKKPWQVSKVNVSQKEMEASYRELRSGDQKLTAVVDVTYKGNPVNDLGDEDFGVKLYSEGEIKREDQWVSSKRLDSPGRYMLRLSRMPELDLGTHGFEFFLDRKEGLTAANFTVSRYIVLNGQITDAAGKRVNANIRVEKDGTTRNYGTRNGNYRIELLPGVYNITVQFDEANARFEGVELRKGVRGSIAYDEISIKRLEGQLEGVSVINSIAITFGYPFERAVIRGMKYDPTTVSFQNAKVFQCKQWMISECGTKWKKVDLKPSNVFPTRGEITFEADSINITRDRNFLKNAFMVVRNTELMSSFTEVKRERVPLGKTVKVEGKALTKSGQPVQGVNIEVKVMKGGQTFRTASATTAEDGVYVANVRAPEEEGLYDIRVKASKSPYTGYEKTIEEAFEVYTKRSLKLEVPDTVEFYPGKESETRFRVTNNGQAEAKDVKVHVRGLKNSWYRFPKKEWSSVSPGSSKTALMKVNLPENYCGEAPCKDYPKFKVEVTGKSGGQELRDIRDIQSVVTKESQTSRSRNSNSSRSSSGLETPGVVSATGRFLASQSSLNIALGLLTVFILSLAGAVKKKTSENGRGGRDRLGQGVSGPGGQPPRVEGKNRQTGGPGKKTNTPESEDPDEQEKDENDHERDKDVEQDHENGGETSEGFECGVCGEQFDTESGRDLHRKAVH